MSDSSPEKPEGPGEPQYSVVQFFDDENTLYEYVVRFVLAEEAVKKAHFYTHNVSARIGMTRRVIITDGQDHTVFEWKYGLGVVFPPPEFINPPETPKEG